MNQKEKSIKTVAVVASVLALLVIFSNWPDSSRGNLVSTGLGYWLAFIGSVSMIVGTVRRMLAR